MRNPVRPDIRSNFSCKNSQRLGVRKVMEPKDEQVDPTGLFSQEEINQLIGRTDECFSPSSFGHPTGGLRSHLVDVRCGASKTDGILRRNPGTSPQWGKIFQSMARTSHAVPPIRVPGNQWHGQLSPTSADVNWDSPGDGTWQAERTAEFEMLTAVVEWLSGKHQFKNLESLAQRI
jgi:hypothetical protein